MAKTPLKNVSIFLGKLSIASQINTIDLGAQVGEVETTNFESGDWREYQGALKDASWNFRGFWDADATSSDPDSTLFAGLGSQFPVSVIPLVATPAAGDVAYFTRGVSLKHKAGGQIGELLGMDLQIRGDAPTIRGKLLETASGVTASANSAAVQLSAVSALQRLYVGVHVISGSGALDLVVQSDNGAGFASPANQITVPQFTAPGSYFGSVAGAITDDYFRIARTVGSGTWSYRVFLGVA